MDDRGHVIETTGPGAFRATVADRFSAAFSSSVPLGVDQLFDWKPTRISGLLHRTDPPATSVVGC
jgi:hypothetical protein